MSTSTRITAVDDIVIACGTQLPATMNCVLDINNTLLLQDTTIDFLIEQPNYKTVEKNEKYFDGKMNCYAYTDASIRSEVKHFSVDIKSGKFSLPFPKFNSEYIAESTQIMCHSDDIAIPANFGVVKTSNGSNNIGRETNVRIRAEYKRSGISRQFADASSRLDNMFYVTAPFRFHGNDNDGNPIPFRPLSKSVSIESSRTIFDAGKGLKLVFKDVQHNVQGFTLAHQSGTNFFKANQYEGPRFSSLAPFNTYYEANRGKYVNCTAEVTANGTTLATFDTTMELLQDAFHARVDFETRDSENHGDWKKVDVNTLNTDVSLSCPTLTLLNPTELPLYIGVTGTFSDPSYVYPAAVMHLSMSSASGLVSTVVFSVVIFAASFLSMF